MRRSFAVILVALGAAAPASAAPAPVSPATPPTAPDADLAEAGRLADRGRLPAAIAVLRRALATADTPGRRCALGLLYARGRDLPRAHLYLLSCPAADPDRVRLGAAARVGLDRSLRASELSPVEITTRPGPLRVEVDSLRGDSVVGPALLWLPAGRHRFRGTPIPVAAAVAVTDAVADADADAVTDAGGVSVEVEVRLASGNRALVELALPRAGAARATRIDLSDDAPPDVHRGAPAPVKRDSLLPDRYRKGVDGRPRRR